MIQSETNMIDNQDASVLIKSPNLAGIVSKLSLLQSYFCHSIGVTNWIDSPNQLDLILLSTTCFSD